MPWFSKQDRTAGTGSRVFYEKSFRRADLARWDAAWHGLSPDARLAYLDRIKGPQKSQSGRQSPQPTFKVDKIGAEVAAELEAAGLIEPVESAFEMARSAEMAPVLDAYDFAIRVRGLRRYALLDPKAEPRFSQYIQWMTYSDLLYTQVARVLEKAAKAPGPELWHDPTRAMQLGRWPEWVAGRLGGDVARRVLDAIGEAPGPVPIAAVADLLPEADPEKVREALDPLIGHAALVEDLDPETHDIVVGYLPAVREAIERAERLAAPAPLVAIPSPREHGPAGVPLLDDLRAVLLEVASSPPRLKQNGELYAKELDRIVEALEPWPGWFEESFALTEEIRASRAFTRVRSLDLVKEVVSGKETRLELNAAGDRWLLGGQEAQATALFEAYRRPPNRTEFYGERPPYMDLLIVPGPDSLLSRYADSYYGYGFHDGRFLGTGLTVAIDEKPRGRYDYHEPKKAAMEALRDSARRALAALEPGAYYTLESVLDHLSRGEKNILNCGNPAEKVQVAYFGRFLPNLEEVRTEAAVLLVRGLIMGRLIPLGGLATARDDQGRTVVARTPYLDAYFGAAELKPGSLTGAAAGETKVVIQPDFTVVVIGLDPTPVAELIPFADRKPGGKAGAQTLTISRASVMRAASRGLKPDEIVARLTRLASHAPPPNVLREVKEWGAVVRQVRAETIAVIRCPDRATADRVAGLLKKSKRLGETDVEVDPKAVTSIDRERLRSQGIFLEGTFAGDGATKKPARRSGW